MAFLVQHWLPALAMPDTKRCACTGAPGPFRSKPHGPNPKTLSAEGERTKNIDRLSYRISNTWNELGWGESDENNRV